MSRAKLKVVPDTAIADVDDATYHLQKARALADALMALTNYTNDPDSESPVDRLDANTLHWIAVQQFDLACEALNIVEQAVDDAIKQRQAVQP